MVSITNAILSWNGFIWTKYSRINQVKFVEDRQPLKKLRVWAASSRPYPFKFFKDCLPNFTWSILENFVTYGCLLLLLFLFFLGNVQTNEMAPNCHITDILTIPLTYLKIFKSSNTSFISIPFKNNAEPPGATFNFSIS